jgi:chemotaxis protein CheD
MANGYEEQLAPNLYFDKYFNVEAAKILPGEYYATGREMMLCTVLGSCVAACIRDYRSGIGGMNHFMLPDSAADDGGPMNKSARYGTYAMEILINQLLKMGARRENLEAKVFGGGKILKGMSAINIGQRNADFVMEFLGREKIRVVAQDLVDIYPRKVYYFPKSGKAMVKKLRSLHNNTIIVREKDYGLRLQKADVVGDVDLFD